jgi:hypothetical protein
MIVKSPQAMIGKVLKVSAFPEGPEYLSRSVRTHHRAGGRPIVGPLHNFRVSIQIHYV